MFPFQVNIVVLQKFVVGSNRVEITTLEDVQVKRHIGISLGPLYLKANPLVYYLGSINLLQAFWELRKGVRGFLIQ